MGIMKEIDILRQEGAREPEDFKAHGYGQKDAEAASELVKAAEADTPAMKVGDTVPIRDSRQPSKIFTPKRRLTSTVSGISTACLEW